MTIRIALMGGELIPALVNNWAPDVWFADVVVNDDHLPSTPLRWEEALLIGFGREFNVMIRVTAIIHRHFYGGGWEDVLDRGRDENGYVVFGDVNWVPPRPCVHLLYHQTETPTVVDGRVVETVRAVTLTSYSRREWIGHQHEMKQNYNDSARSKSGSGKDGDSGSRNSGRSGWCVIGGRCRGGGSNRFWSRRMRSYDYIGMRSGVFLYPADFRPLQDRGVATSMCCSKSCKESTLWIKGGVTKPSWPSGISAAGRKLIRTWRGYHTVELYRRMWPSSGRGMNCFMPRPVESRPRPKRGSSRSGYGRTPLTIKST